ncbi:MAG: dUTP diphosphatase [Ginsengibacter sp.]
MQKVSIKIINRSTNNVPAYATEGSAGMDLQADLEDQVTLQPLQRALIPTGIYLEIPDGYEAQVRPRSGLAINKGITCLNSPGTVESDYRGELQVILINLSQEDQTISHGDRIAQIVIAKVEKADCILVQQLNFTARGEGGFGHTGTN